MSAINLDLLENLPDAFAYHKLVRNSDGQVSDYIFLYVNKAFTIMTGLEKETVINKKVTDIFPDISNSKFNWIDVYANVVKTGQTFNFEQYFDPLFKWYEVTAFSYEPEHFGTVFKEITKSVEEKESLTKTIQDLLIQPSNVLEGFFSVTLDLLCIADINGNFLKVNKAWSDVLGYPTNEIENRKFLDFIHPDDLEKTKNALAELSEQDDVFNFVNRYRAKDGTYKYIEWKSHPKGNIIYAAARDITERRLSQIALAESERTKSILIANLPGMVYRCKNDPNWTMEFVSDGCFELTGHKPEALIGNSKIAYNEIIMPQYREFLLKQWDKKLSEKSKFKEEYEIKTASGEIKWVLETGEGIFNQKGKVVSLEGFIFDITDRKENEIKLENMSGKYGLTGLNNKQKFERDLENEKSPKDTKKAVLLINFPKVNLISLSYGYTYTEYLMKRIAKILRKFISKNNSLYQISIDKYLLYIRDYKDRKELNEISINILNTLRQLPTIQTTGCNIGIYNFRQKIKVDNLIKNALAASEHADNEELFAFSYFNDKIRTKIQRSSKIKELLLAVIDGSQEDAFSLEYQPIINIKNNKIAGYEALARLYSNRLGNIVPEEFIPIAEETQLIIPLGNKIISQACEFIKKLINEQNPDLKVFVNISAVQLLRSEFIPALKEAFDTGNINPNNFGVEITESIFFDQFESINKKFEVLKNLGVCIAIDDFGTGYSSLAREGELNVNSIKIDKYFIDKISSKNMSKVVAGDIISMAHKLGHNVVAEGVETLEQLEYLRQHNCDMAQGFLFSKSVEKDVILKGDIYGSK